MSDGPPPAKRMRYDLTKFFEVLVGQKPNQQRFPVYHDLLTQRSGFFRAARSERSNQDPTEPTTLDDVDVEVFSAYLHCVNFGAESLACLVQDIYPQDQNPSDAGSDDDDLSDEEKGLLWEPVEKFLIDLYLLADKLIDPVAANLAIDELITVVEKRGVYFSVTLVQFVYESTTQTSPLRKLILDYHIDGNPNENLAAYIEDRPFPPDFIRDLLFKVLAINRVNTGKLICDVYSSEALQPENYHQAVEKATADTVASKQEEK